MQTINIRTDVAKAVADLQAMGTTLSKRQINTAIVRGINKTLLLGRTTARAAVKQNYTIAQRGLDGRIDVVKASVYHNANKSLKDTYLTGAVVASPKPVPMNLFKVVFAYSSTSSTSISKRGVQKTNLKKSRLVKRGGGVFIEAQRGVKEIIPYAFFLPTMSGSVFSRGKYKPGGSSFGFRRRHTRSENANGNDSVTPLTSVTVHAAIINPKSEQLIADRVNNGFLNNVTHELEVIAKGIVK